MSDAASALGVRVLARLAESGVVSATAPETSDVAVLLGAADPDALARRRESLTAGAAAVLDRLDTAHHVVLVSSAMVYGAWENNPVPLTEDAVVRPDPEFTYARQVAAVEQLVEDWRVARPGRTATVLRPAIALSADGSSGLARALAAGMGQRVAADDPPAQFVHLDDLATAVQMGAVRCLDGVYNVAPDGFVPSRLVRALAGLGPRARLPDRVADLLAAARWRFQRGPIPPGLLGYTRAPWLVANDRLKAEGWTPTVTNEQAYVEGTEVRWWTMVSPKRRQELALAGAGLLIAVAGVATALVIRRVRSRRVRR